MLLWILRCKYLFKLVFSFLDIYPGVELLGHMVVLFLVFWESSILFSTVAAPIYIPTNDVGGFPFLHILANICYVCSFWWSPSWQVWSDISLWFWFAFPWWLVMLSIFSFACWPSAFPLWKNVYSGFLAIFNWAVCFFDVCVCIYIYIYIYICWILNPYQSYHLKISFSI